MYRFDTINIHLWNRPDWFRKKNPLGKVPIIEYQGQLLYESLIISEYLDQVYLEPKLQTTDPYLKAREKMFVEYSSKVSTIRYRK